MDFKYGNTKLQRLNQSYSVNNKKSSIWWSDFKLIMGVWDSKFNWFGDNISCKLGDSSTIDFWKYKWFGSTPLYFQFLTLFDYFQESRHMVADAEHQNNGDWSWCLDFHFEPIVCSNIHYE